MADWNDPVGGTGLSFSGMLACLVGSLLSLRTVTDAPPTARALAVGSSFLTGIFFGRAIAEYFNATPFGSDVILLVAAFLSINFLGGLATFSIKFKKDPTEAVSWLMSLWRGSK